MKRKNLLVVIFILFFYCVVFGENNYETGLEYLRNKDYENADYMLELLEESLTERLDS